MNYNYLGKTNIKVSEFALGCWPFAGGSVWGYQDKNDSISTVHAALDNGINFCNPPALAKKRIEELNFARGVN